MLWVEHWGLVMDSLVIKSASTKSGRLKFIKMPWPIYQNDPHWVPPLIFDQNHFLDPAKGEFFEFGEVELLLAYRGNKPVGRISAHINRRHEEMFHDKKGFFGFFECENNPETARALFESASGYLKKNGMKSMEGPFNFNIYDEMGLLVDGFDSDPYIMNTHNPAYYRGLFEKNGFIKSVDWYAFRARRGKTDANLDEKFYKIRDRTLKNSSVTIRQARGRKYINQEAEIVRSIFSKAWSKNWGHVDLTEREWLRIKSALSEMVIFPLTVIAEVNGSPVGFALSIYDANQALKKMNGRLLPFGFRHLLEIDKTDRFRLILMGVLEEYRGKGLEAAMYLSVIEEAVKRGFNECEMSNIVETNTPMISSLEHLDVERYKTYRIYIKDIN
jgi:GNAT superfamily N-acetyltransferase